MIKCINHKKYGVVLNAINHFICNVLINGLKTWIQFIQMNWWIGVVQSVICFIKINCQNILVFAKNKKSLKQIRIPFLIHALKFVVRREDNFALILAQWIVILVHVQNAMYKEWKLNVFVAKKQNKCNAVKLRKISLVDNLVKRN